MGLQLILCMETNERVKSDYIYINNTIKFFYELDQSNIRISPVYMCGKGNYNSSGVRKKISKFGNVVKVIGVKCPKTRIDNTGICVCS